MIARHPEQVYLQERSKYERLVQQLLKKQNQLGWTRLIIILVTIVASYLAIMNLGVWGWIVALVGISVFLYIVSVDAANNEKLAEAKSLVSVNEVELQILNNQYFDRFNGVEYEPNTHPYAADVDVFGNASLYQYINRCETEQGKALLAMDFLALLDVDTILERHEAIIELQSLLEWRQRLQAAAKRTPINIALQLKIEQWLQDEEKPYADRKWKYIIQIYSVVTVGLGLAAALGYIPGAVFSMIFLICFIFSSSLSKKVIKPYIRLSGIVKEVDTLHELIHCIESGRFKSPKLQLLQRRLQTENRSASAAIKELKEILNRFDLRLNVFVFLFLNSFILWDVRLMRALNSWRENHKQLLPDCFTVIAEMEVLNSLAVLHFNQPDWTFPVFKEYFTLEGSAIGHPLIPASKRVTSDFSLHGTGKIALVTGSNMAGKSTFLRSLGVNIILAQLGAPVCAKHFALSPMQLMSSMRIADNLAESTSTFYAELKKLEAIIKEVKQHKPLFILLDEILRGTNSLDRHIGSKALIRQLIKENAVAVIATHDVELTELEKEYKSAIENYHFDVQVENDELYFDYKLKNGICRSLNASILMKKIGIEL